MVKLFIISLLCKTIISNIHHFSNIVSNSGLTADQLQNPNIHDAMNILLQNLESQANDLSQNETNNTNNDQSNFRNSNGLLNLVRFGQGLPPIIEDTQNNVDSTNMDDSNSGSDNNESVDINQNMDSLENNQYQHTNQVSENYNSLLQRLYDTHSTTIQNIQNTGEEIDLSNNLVQVSSENQTEDQQNDTSVNQTQGDNNRSGIRRRINTGPLPSNRRRRNTNLDLSEGI